MLRRQPLLLTGCLLGSMGIAANAAEPTGVAFAGDLQSIDRAMLDAAQLPLPSVASGPVLTPRTAPQSAATSAMGRPAPVVPAAYAAEMRPRTSDQPETKPSFFSRLKPSWLFSKSEPEQPAVDPFAAAIQDARIQTVGAATQRRDEGVERIPSYVQQGAPRPAANFQTQQGQASRAGSPALKPIAAGSKPTRNGGVAVRSGGGPKRGLLSGLWGSDDAAESPAVMPKPQARRPSTSTASTAPVAPTRIAQAPATAPRPMAYAPSSATPLPSNDSRSLASSGVVMISDDAGASASPAGRKPSPIAMVSPEKPLPTTSSKSTPKPMHLTSTPQVTTLENQFAKAQGPLATPASTQPPHAQLPSSEDAKVVSKPASAPVVVSLPPNPMPAPLQQAAAEPVAAAATPAPATYATTSPSRTEQASPSDETSERAKALLAEAHQLAATAATAEDYSGVLQRCRYVLAIDNSEQAVAYANQLAGWALCKRGEVLEDADRFAEAKTDYQDALHCDAECWRAEHALGVLAAREGNNEEALRRFNRTLLLNPEFAKSYSNRAALAVQNGDYESALRDYQLAIEIDPDLEAAHTGRGRVCHLLGLLDEGLRHLDAAELLSPDDAMIATGRGDVLVDLGRYGQAKAAYERAIALDPQQPAAYRNLAWMQATCPVDEFRDGAAAVVNVQQAEELAGGADDLTLDTKAAALAAAGRFDEAAAVQQQAIDAAPTADAAYSERLAMYRQGTSFTSQPVAVRQATYLK
ncbi:lipoprotein NlpI [Botrimarina colliarenosi]|uniref:Lipoprotein NlpI n=1 Tax=Botrimarina colliarenosi TaxID=2528001 RepID=A0A5C6AMK9_9BACT|nr:tetratricopeptide repeat protein [Botrimarina colliarenosi]TWT99403.1 lipoprotein NlpI [Botrimarina colliarenosi]